MSCTESAHILLLSFHTLQVSACLSRAIRWITAASSVNSSNHRCFGLKIGAQVRGNWSFPSGCDRYFPIIIPLCIVSLCERRRSICCLSWGELLETNNWWLNYDLRVGDGLHLSAILFSAVISTDTTKCVCVCVCVLILFPPSASKSVIQFHPCLGCWWARLCLCYSSPNTINTWGFFPP